MGADTGDADAIMWLADRGLQRVIEEALRSVLGDAWTEAWAVGQASAKAVLANVVADWGGWAPGNPAAARKLIGGAQALEDLLHRYGIDRIKGIARSRLEQLAARLAQALRDGWSSDRLSRELRDVLDNPSNADTVAQTEISRAQSQASLDTYRQMGVAATEWLISPSNVCIVCETNANASPVRLGQIYPSGDDAPPAHPNCRCAPMPVLTFDPLV
ncbi:MAG: phage minor head protein [Actinoallomurus sp.]